MRDVTNVLRESVETAYELGARERAGMSDVKRTVLRRGRRRRRAGIALAAAAAVTCAAGVPVAARSVFRRDAEVAARQVPDVGAKRVWKTGAPVATDGRSVWFGRGTIESESGRLTNVARLDPATGVVEEGPVAVSHPHQIAASDSGLWAVGWSGDMPVGGEGHPVDGSITRVDPDTLVRSAFIDREDSAPYDVAVGESGGREVVWVVDLGLHRLLEIDSVTAEIVGVRDTATNPSSVYALGNHVYVTSSEEHVVERFDVTTGEVVRFDVPKCANDAEVAAGSLWVVDYCGNALHRIDESTGEIVASIDVGKAPSTLEVADGLVWVAADERVVRVDPRTNAVTGNRVYVEGLFAHSMAYASGSMFVGSVEGVYRLDESIAPASPTPTPPPTPDPAEAELPEGVDRVTVASDPNVLATGAGSLWTGLWTVDRLDPETGEVLAQIDAGGFVQDLDFDSDAGVLWALVDMAEEKAHGVVAIDAATNEVELGPLRVNAGDAAGRKLDARDGVAWVARTGGTVVGIDLATRELVEFGLREHFRGVEVHVAAMRDSVFVVGTNGIVVQANPRTGAVQQVEDLGPSVSAIVAGEDVFWVAQLTRAGELVMWPLDGETGERTRGRVVAPAGGYPYLAEHEGTLWVAEQGGADTAVVVSAFTEDADENATFELPPGTIVTDVAAGPSGGWVRSGLGFLYRIGPR